MSDPAASPIKKKKEKKKEKKERKGDKKSKKEKGGSEGSSTNDNNDQSNPPKTPSTTTETPRMEEASPERLEFESLFKRILHDEIADNRLAFALSMVNFGLNHDELAGVWLKEYKKAVQDEKSGLRPPVKNPLPLRQLQFLREWITVFEPTFSTKTCEILLDAMQEGKDPAAHISEFKELFAKHNSDGRGEPKDYPILASFPKINAVPVSVYQSIMGLDGATERPSVDILAGVSPNTLAKQLTALEHQLIQTVRADELVGLTWTKFPERAPNLLNVTTQFNRVSYWVATEIVLTSSAREQAALVKKFVQVCKECLTLNNFNTCMEILSGLNHVSVQRLKRMWEKVPTGTMNLFKSLEDIMTTQQNFSNYREKISQCTPPALPYLGVYLKDLTFIYDGNLKYTPEGRINFDLFNLVYERWKNLNQYQAVPYATLDKIRFDNLLETLGAYDHHNEDLLYEMSLQAQPSIWANRPLDSSDRNFALQSASDISILDELEDSTSRDGSGRDMKTLEDPKTDSSDDLTLEKRHLGRKPSMTDVGTEDSDEGSSTSSHAGPRQKRLAKAAVFAKKDQLVTVKVPPNLVKSYIKAESIVDRYFAHCYQSKKFGTIEIFDQRYLLLRAPSLSVDFVSTIHKDLEWLISQADATKFANKLLFDFAYTLGKSDAHNFAQRMKAEGKNLSAQQILFAEPMVLSYLGWSYADVHKGMNVDPANPKDFYMCFDRTYSFEASAWNRQIEEKKGKPKHAICIMSCGYTSGWSSDAHGTNLLTVEVLCKAKGDPTCTFITAHSECIEAHVEKFCSENKLSRAQKKIIHIPDLNMVGKKDKKKKTATASILGKKSPKVDLKDKEARERGKTKGAIETYEPVQLPSFKPDDKTMKNINRMQRIQLKGTKLAFALFQGRVCDTARGTVEINKEPYVFLRAKAMSVEFFPLMQALYPTGEKEAALEFATKFLLDFGISLGKADFKHYVNKMKLGQAPPTYHILALPRILAELGWGQMDIDFKTARLSQTEKKVFLKYKLKRSAEALAWKEERHQHPNTYADMKAPACVMHCGYMNGYVTECFTEKAELAVVEVCCEGRGDLYCEFIVAHRQKIGKLIAGYYQAHDLPSEKIQTLEVLRLLDERSKKSKKAIKADNWGF